MACAAIGFGSRQAFPRRSFSIKASAAEGFFCLHFSSLKKAGRSPQGGE